MSFAFLLAVLPAVVDFGPEGVGGYPEITVSGVTSSAVVRVAYATHPDGLGPKGDFWHETRATYLGEDVWLPILPASTDRYDLFTVTSNGVWRAPLAQGLVRYAKWSVDSGAAEVTAIRFVNQGIHSTEAVVGSFACSDARLDALWRASVRTCQLAAIPARLTPLVVTGSRSGAELGPTLPYVSDGAKRDRLVWSGDLWWAQRNMYVAFAFDSPYMSGSIRMLGENQCEDGYVQACPYPESHAVAFPLDRGPFGSDEFAAWFVPVVWDHYLCTGDAATARDAYPHVVRLMDYLEKGLGRQGLFEPCRETSKCASGLTFGARSLHHTAYLNILLWKAFQDAASLGDYFGDKTEAGEWRSVADSIAASVRKSFWDAQKGWFRQSVEEDVWSREGNALALATHFATKAEAVRIVPQLRFHSHGKFQALAMRGAFEYGFGEKALELLKGHNWLKMVSPDWKGVHTTYECMGLFTKGWGDEAHPDTAVAGILSNYILGVEPLDPGYARFRVKVRAPKEITWAHGRVPTPHGLIQVSWRVQNGMRRIETIAPPALKEVK